MGCEKIWKSHHPKNIHKNKKGVNKQILDQRKSLHKNKWSVNEKKITPSK